jgi:prevent-host-death family protein
MATANQWPTSEAKAKFAEVLDAADKHGPQTILKNGKRKSIVMSAEDFDRREKPKESLWEFFRNSPLRRSGIKIERIRSQPRPVKF